MCDPSGPPYNRDKAQVNIIEVPSLKLHQLDRRERNYLIQVINTRFPNYLLYFMRKHVFINKPIKVFFIWMVVHLASLWWEGFEQLEIEKFLSIVCSYHIIYFKYTNLDISLSFSIITSKIQPHHTRPPHFINLPCSVICHRNKINHHSQLWATEKFYRWFVYPLALSWYHGTSYYLCTKVETTWLKFFKGNRRETISVHRMVAKETALIIICLLVLFTLE